ncbi:uncharacterized protein [Cardiocondyla obscurior]|uniref:uncharacterized protein n=1 Tax=Cardiocondyla obscurior TaxID=286306 RepID=UPI0039658957
MLKNIWRTTDSTITGDPDEDEEEMATSGTSGVTESTEPAQINRVAMRMPPMIPDEPELWFAQLESQFTICGITQENTKYAYTLSQLETKYTREIKDLIRDPPAEGRYQNVKKTLIQRLAVSQEQKLRQLLEHEELGDRRPTQFLRHLKSLAGLNMADDRLRTLWISRLPTQMQVILATRHGDPLEQVAEQADKIMEVSGNLPTVAAVKRNFKENEPNLEEAVEKLRRQVAALSTKLNWRSRSRDRDFSRGRNRSKFRSNNREAICFFHKRFKEKARKCEQPCNFKKENEKGDH